MYKLDLLLILLMVGYVFGHIAEQRHYRSIIRRETAFRRISVFTTRGAISVDYFKRFLVGLRMLVGGGIASYKSLTRLSRNQ